jgi:hypothetical protein
VRPLTPGTQATVATHIGEGNYASVMTMGSDPQLNVVRGRCQALPARHQISRCRSHRPGHRNEVDPAYVDDATLTLRRFKDTARAVAGLGPVQPMGSGRRPHAAAAQPGAARPRWNGVAHGRRRSPHCSGRVPGAPGADPGRLRPQARGARRS